MVEEWREKKDIKANWGGGRGGAWIRSFDQMSEISKILSV
jgi:hypothetical protein